MSPSLFKSAGPAVLVLLLAACAPRYPLDIPETQWQTMSTEQRLQAQEKQAALDRAVEERRAAEARAREAEAAQKQAELDARRRDARYGERVQCILSHAEAQLGGKKWRNVEPVALDLVQGLEVAFDLKEASGRTFTQYMTAYGGFDGQTLTLCRDADSDRRNANACLRVLGTFADYARGIEHRIDSDHFLRGRLRCDLVPGPGMPRRVLLNGSLPGAR